MTRQAPGIITFTESELKDAKVLFSRDPRTGNIIGSRMDADETLFIERALTQIEEVRINTEYAPLEGLEAVPIVPDLPLGFEFVEWHRRTFAGEAEFVDASTTNVPQISAGTEPNKDPVKLIAVGFNINIQQMAASARMGENLQADMGAECELGIRYKFHKTIMFGDPEADMHGLFRPTSAGGPKGFTKDAITASSAAADDLITLNGATNAVGQNSKQVVRPNRLILPDTVRDIIANKARSTNVDRTVLEHFESTNQYLGSSDASTPDANTGTVGGLVSLRSSNFSDGLHRGLAYRFDPSIVKCRVMAPRFWKAIEKPFGTFFIYIAAMAPVQWLRPYGAHVVKLKTS